ncbi:MAG: polymer-forming cytoskeletal protein [Alphaproteobacteria bacterium]|nr:polymer-forming cytoskeletal protein [Alphaproteobacteria bacterium]
MTATNDDSGERGEPDLSFLESRPARAAEIPNMSLGRSSIGEGPRTVDSRALTIGRDIKLSGEITECELLVIEGRLEASVPNAKSMEIAQSGSFQGTATLGDATISGEFDGELTVTNRLRITSTGRVSGTIQYGHLEIENGGEIHGELTVST